MPMKRSIYKSHYKIAFWSTLAVSAGLMISSFCLPPEGEIHPSVLKGAAELFLWPALAFGTKALDEGKTARITHKNTSITVGDDEEDHFDGPGHHYREEEDCNENYENTETL